MAVEAREAHRLVAPRTVLNVFPAASRTPAVGAGKGYGTALNRTFARVIETDRHVTSQILVSPVLHDYHPSKSEILGGRELYAHEGG